ncbi:MAG: NAD(P)/FAD-dependent oxidoreductase [Candidatus Rokubacteria bacterium]|nr:NAD(P)/FAD-dependent oxidoreductase [Candidatus Rokubacteria bacterium]
MMSDLRDVIVVGAGPAGLYAAWRLAQEGLEVTVVEEHPVVGVPTHCTGLVSAEVDEYFKIPPSIVLHRPLRCLVISPGGVTADFTNPGEELAAIDRGAFDQALAVSAQAAGATVITGHRVDTVTIGSEHVEVRTAAASPLRGRVLVLACGVTYRFHGLMDAGVPAPLLHSAQLELEAEPATALEIYLGKRVAPGGFGWLVPIQRGERSYLKAGVLLRGDARAHLRRLLAQPSIAARLKGVPGEPIRRLVPVGWARRSFGGRVVAVGDAAGLTKPVTGGGIFYSLYSSAVAAETLVEALRDDDLSAARLSRYETRWRQRLVPEMRAASWFRRVVANLSDGELDQFVEAAASDAVQAVVTATARFNWHRPVIMALVRQRGIKSILLRVLFR